MEARPKWTGDAVGMMHVHRISHEELAEKIGWSRRYLYRILEGSDTPAKARKKVLDAINAIRIERVKTAEAEKESA